MNLIFVTFFSILLVALLGWYFRYLGDTNTDKEKSDFYRNLSAGFFGSALTALLTLGTVTVYQVNEQDRQSVLATKQYRSQLITDMGSADNGLALNAVARLRELGMLTDGSLRNQHFVGADLHNADLSGADLRGVNLRTADLRGANLFRANLEGADLKYALLQQVNAREFFEADRIRATLFLQFRQDIITGGPESALKPIVNASLGQSWFYGVHANLRRADLRGADVTGADLSWADMENALLIGANFSGANLHMVNLRGSAVSDETFDIAIAAAFGGDVSKFERLSTASTPIFSDKTLLPNGTFWNKKVNMEEFSKPEGKMAFLQNCRAYAQDLIVVIEQRATAIAHSTESAAANPPLGTPAASVQFTPTPAASLVATSEVDGKSLPPIQLGCGWNDALLPYPPRQIGPFRGQ